MAQKKIEKFLVTSYEIELLFDNGIIPLENQDRYIGYCSIINGVLLNTEDLYKKFGTDVINFKEASIYEAIPELIPDGMKYDKKLDQLLSNKIYEWANDDILHITSDRQDFKHKTYGDIIEEILQKENTICKNEKDINITLEDKQILDELKKSGKSYLEIINLIKNTDTFTPSYYGAKCKCGEKLDAYAICDKYSNEHKPSAWHHAVKKLIRAGDGHKPLLKDIDEVIDSLKRWKEQLNAK